MKQAKTETQKKMRLYLKLEEVGQFLLSIILFLQLDYKGWIFPALLFTPDLSMVGYVFNPKLGAFLYNLFHHKFTAVIVFALGYGLNIPILTLAGLILFGHSAMDRIFGYGLKYKDSFWHTHLGWIGKRK